MNGIAIPRVAFIGFGEAGQAMAAGLREAGAREIAVWDILFPQAEGVALQQAGEAIGVRVATSARDAAQDADIVFSAVTAASSVEAAESIKSHLRGEPFFFDLNSVSPGRKQKTAKLLGEAARYVDLAVLSPINPKRHRSAMLMSGPHVAAAAPILDTLQMQPAIAEGDIGAAAAIKMVRSVIIKGIEALTLECFLAASRAGVVDPVAASLRNNYPGLDWGKMIEYNLERMATHGIRRAAEMEEVAATLRELGVEPLMAQATVERQRQMGEIGKQPAIRSAHGRKALLDALNAAIKQPQAV